MMTGMPTEMRSNRSTASQIVHTDAAVRRVGADRRILARRHPVDADAGRACTHPSRPQRVLGAWRDGLRILGPVRVGRQPGGVLGHGDDGVRAGGRGVFRLTGRDRVALHEVPVLVQVQAQLADVHDDLAAEGAEHRASDDAVRHQAVFLLEADDRIFRAMVVHPRLAAAVHAGVLQPALQLAHVVAARSRPQHGRAEVLGAVDDEGLLVPDDVAAAIGDGDEQHVLALRQALQPERGAVEAVPLSLARSPSSSAVSCGGPSWSRPEMCTVSAA